MHKLVTNDWHAAQRLATFILHCNVKGGKRMRGKINVTDQIEHTQARDTNNSLCIGYLTGLRLSSIENDKPPTHKSTTCALGP